MTTREIYDRIYCHSGNSSNYESFKRMLRKWKRKRMADEGLLVAGTFPQFVPHGATVQVDGKGNVTQTWVKQHRDIDWKQIAEFLSKSVNTSKIEPTTLPGDTMLEIPLFDMHFGIATMDTYRDELSEILGIISDRRYDQINILFGQDVLHNNDLRGHTASGTPIEQVDFVRSWKDAWEFFRIMIDKAIGHSKDVRMYYSPGNHDECASWGLFKALEVAYPQVFFDDSIEPRKCLFWRGCFVGFGHCEYTNKNSLLFQNFVLDFPEQFAAAKVREIHSGHLHRESIDEGLMVRRLPSAVPTDKWSSKNGYVGAHKRFQLFEYSENRLKSIHFI